MFAPLRRADKGAASATASWQSPLPVAGGSEEPFSLRVAAMPLLVDRFHAAIAARTTQANSQHGVGSDQDERMLEENPFDESNNADGNPFDETIPCDICGRGNRIGNGSGLLNFEFPPGSGSLQEHECSKLEELIYKENLFADSPEFCPFVFPIAVDNCECVDQNGNKIVLNDAVAGGDDSEVFPSDGSLEEAVSSLVPSIAGASADQTDPNDDDEGALDDYSIVPTLEAITEPPYSELEDDEEDDGGSLVPSLVDDEDDESDQPDPSLMPSLAAENNTSADDGDDEGSSLQPSAASSGGPSLVPVMSSGPSATKASGAPTWPPFSAWTEQPTASPTVTAGPTVPATTGGPTLTPTATATTDAPSFSNEVTVTVPDVTTTFQNIPQMTEQEVQEWVKVTEDWFALSYASTINRRRRRLMYEELLRHETVFQQMPASLRRRWLQSNIQDMQTYIDFISQTPNPADNSNTLLYNQTLQFKTDSLVSTPPPRDLIAAPYDNGQTNQVYSGTLKATMPQVFEDMGTPVAPADVPAPAPVPIFTSSPTPGRTFAPSSRRTVAPTPTPPTVPAATPASAAVIGAIGGAVGIGVAAVLLGIFFCFYFYICPACCRKKKRAAERDEESGAFIERPVPNEDTNGEDDDDFLGPGGKPQDRGFQDNENSDSRSTGSENDFNNRNNNSRSNSRNPDYFEEEVVDVTVEEEDDNDNLKNKQRGGLDDSTGDRSGGSDGYPPKHDEQRQKNAYDDDDQDYNRQRQNYNDNDDDEEVVYGNKDRYDDEDDDHRQQGNATPYYDDDSRYNEYDPNDDSYNRNTQSDSNSNRDRPYDMDDRYDVEDDNVDFQRPPADSHRFTRHDSNSSYGNEPRGDYRAPYNEPGGDYQHQSSMKPQRGVHRQPEVDYGEELD